MKRRNRQQNEIDEPAKKSQRKAEAWKKGLGTTSQTTTWLKVYGSIEKALVCLNHLAACKGFYHHCKL